MPWTLNTCHSSNFDACFLVKINKVWNFCLKVWFFRDCLSQRLKTCSIGFGMPQTLNTHHSSHFDAFLPVKINKMWNIGCFLNSLWPNTVKMSICTGKSVHKGLQICTLRFLGMPITIHYIRTFVWQVLFELLWFFCIFYGKVKIYGS